VTAVVHAAWTAAGSWAPDPDPTLLRPGTCARCGEQPAELARVTAAISKLFTAFDGWHDPTRPGLCHPCAWAYRDPTLRRHAHLVTTTPNLVQLTAASLADELSAGPIASDTALIVPLRPGRKHLLPEARWGAVTTDSATIPWTSADSTRLAAMTRLRDDGFGTRMLRQPAPAWQVLHTRPTEHWSRILADWAQLDAWRHRPPWLDLGLHATTPSRP
jgi:hypothetical protein